MLVPPVAGVCGNLYEEQLSLLADSDIMHVYHYISLCNTELGYILSWHLGYCVQESVRNRAEFTG